MRLSFALLTALALTAFATAILLVDGLAQTAGAAMLIVGLAHKKKLLVRDEFATVHVTPMMFGSGAGIGIVGSM